MKSLIIFPTYNEKDNIIEIIKAVFEQLPEGVDILVVDDNSPDGTAQVVQKLADSDPRVHLLLREKKQGLGRAYIAGFEWGLSKAYDVFVEMDADFSHRPVDLVKILKEVVNVDFAVGSRYVIGGGTKNWGLLRKIISRGGSIYARLILGFPMNDWTGGFNAWKRNVLEAIGLRQIQSNGYSFQIELKYKAQKLGFKGLEVPIQFEERRIGQSKMSLHIVLEAFYKVWMIRFK
jgi:dolichol-phosphate mannosyltransferase